MQVHSRNKAKIFFTRSCQMGCLLKTNTEVKRTTADTLPSHLWMHRLFPHHVYLVVLPYQHMPTSSLYQEEGNKIQGTDTSHGSRRPNPVHSPLPLPQHFKQVVRTNILPRNWCCLLTTLNLWQELPTQMLFVAPAQI